MTDHRFGGFILAAIAVNSVLFALEDYNDPGRLNGNLNLRNQIVSLPHAILHTSISCRIQSPSLRHVVASVSMAEKEAYNFVSHGSVHWLSLQSLKPALSVMGRYFSDEV